MNGEKTPDAFAAERCRIEIERQLAPDAFGRPLEVHALLESTNDRAKALARSGAPEGAAVLALAQSRGRGQHGRAWVSPPGKGVYLSVVFRPALPARRGLELPMVAALAAADVLVAAGLADVRVKAPNDVYARGRKIGGVLIEPSIAGGRIEFAVAGIGLNLSQTEDDWRDAGLEGRATSCRMEGAAISLAEAAARLLEALARTYQEWREGGSALRARWMELGGAPPDTAGSTPPG